MYNNQLALAKQVDFTVKTNQTVGIVRYELYGQDGVHRERPVEGMSGPQNIAKDAAGNATTSANHPTRFYDKRKPPDTV
jgi:hypothetical protein